MCKLVIFYFRYEKCKPVRAYTATDEYGCDALEYERCDPFEKYTFVGYGANAPDAPANERRDRNKRRTCDYTAELDLIPCWKKVPCRPASRVRIAPEEVLQGRCPACDTEKGKVPLREWLDLLRKQGHDVRELSEDIKDHNNRIQYVLQDLHDGEYLAFQTRRGAVRSEISREYLDAMRRKLDRESDKWDEWEDEMYEREGDIFDWREDLFEWKEELREWEARLDRWGEELVRRESETSELKRSMYEWGFKYFIKMMLRSVLGEGRR